MKPCLLIIDLQNDFLASLDASLVAALIAGTNRLVRAFRSHGLPIVWIRQEFRADLSDAFLEMRDRSVARVIEGTEGARFHPGLDVSAADTVFIKKRYSAFFGTGLHTHLDDLRIGPLVLCGINTHACIRMSAIDAYQHDHRVVLVEDCIGSHDDEHARVSLRYMHGKVARLMRAEDVLGMVRDALQA